MHYPILNCSWVIYPYEPGASGVTEAAITLATAVLVECGFLSSAEDREMLTDERKQGLIAMGIAAGINRFSIT